MKELKKYRALKELADCYYEEHKSVIQKQIQKEKTKRILNTLPGLLQQGYKVWCRNASVCQVVTPCVDLECEYKTPSQLLGDIAQGCSQCQLFQITTSSNNWAQALHIFQPSDVVKFKV